MVHAGSSGSREQGSDYGEIVESSSIHGVERQRVAAGLLVEQRLECELTGRRKSVFTRMAP